MSATRQPRLLADSGGGAAIGFALILPLLLAMCLGLLEAALVGFDLHRAGEATRRAARMASILPPVGNLTGLAGGASVTCTDGGTGVSCSGAPTETTASFTAILNDVQDIWPEVAGGNLRITYRLSGIGDPETPGGVLPLVTVELVNFDHRFLLLRSVPGIGESLRLPSFSTTTLAGSYYRPN